VAAPSLTLLWGVPQAAPVEDRANIQAQTVSLMNVAHAHLAGKEAFARGIAKELIEDFLVVEERFAKSGLTEQETIDLMRTVRRSFVRLLMASLLLRCKKFLILKKGELGLKHGLVRICWSRDRIACL
jgi:hypothetical protein